MESVSENRSHGGTQGVFRHQSCETGTEMTLSIFVPDHGSGTKLPVLWFLSGLTCTHANMTEKGEYRAACAEHGIVFVAPDTSSRGDDVPDVTQLPQLASHRRLIERNRKFVMKPPTRSINRQRTTPWIAGIGPCSTLSARAWH